MLARISPALLVLGLIACGTEASAPIDETAPSAATSGDDATATPKGDGESATTPATATAHETDLFTKTSGDPKNPAVIYVHGGPGGNGTMFEDTIASTLVKKGLFAVSYDQRGSGRSPKGTKEDFTVAKFVEDLDNVIFTLKLDKPVLIGHSWGGTLALKYQEAHPDRVAGTVLVGNPIDFPDALSNIHERCLESYESSFFGGDDDAKAIKELHARMFPKGLEGPFHFAGEDIGQTMEAASDCNLYVPALSNLLGTASTWGSLMLTSPDKDLLMANTPEVGAGLQENDHLFESNTWDVVEKLKSKVFAIYGSEDGLFSDAQVKRLEGVVGSDHFKLVDGASHVVFVDDPETFTETFLKDVAALRGN